MNNWDKILKDFAHKCGDGGPSMTNPNHLTLLRESLIKFGWKENATNEFIGNLREGKEIITEDEPGVFMGYIGGDENKKRYFPNADKLKAAIDRGSVTAAPGGSSDEDEEGGEDDKKGEDFPEERRAQNKRVDEIRGSNIEQREERYGDGFSPPKGEDSDKGSAPGNAGSQLNEDGGNDICENILNDPEFEKLSEKEQVEWLKNKLQDTKLSKQNNKVDKTGKSSPAGYLGVRDLPEDVPKSEREIYSKCLLAVRNGRRKAQKVNDFLKKAGWEKEDTTSVGFGGTEEDLNSAQEAIDQCDKVIGFIDGKKVEIPKELINQFIKNSGGGENPSDTNTIVINKRTGEATIFFASDKDSLAALIAQSTQKEEWTGRTTTEFLDGAVETGVITEEEKIEVLKTRTRYTYKLDEIESSFKLLSQEPSKKLLGGLGKEYDTQEVIDAIKTASDSRDPKKKDKYWRDRVQSPFGEKKLSETNKKGESNSRAVETEKWLNAGNPNRKPPFVERDKNGKVVKVNPPTDEEMLRAFLTKQSTEIPTGLDLDLINRLNKKFGMVDQTEQRLKIEEKRKQALSLEQQMLDEMDEKVNVDGVGIGTLLSSNNCWDKGHFDALLGTEGTVHEYDEMFEVNASGYHIDKKVLEECLELHGDGAKKDFQKKFGREMMVDQLSGDTITDPETGEKRKRVTGGSSILYSLKVDEKGKAIIDPETGEQAKMNFMDKRIRTKQGEMARGNTVYGWHPDLQKCIEEHGKNY